jgi:hypothetical protein
MDISTARVIVSKCSQTFLSSDIADVFRLVEAAEVADRFHAERILAGRKAAATRLANAAAHDERVRAAKRSQAGRRAALTRELRRQIASGG